MRSFNIIGSYDKYAGKNIYNAIGKIYPNLSVGNLNKVFRLKDVKVNKVRVTKEYILNKNDLVEIYLNDDILFNTSLKLKYIYEDDNILAVYKPTKMPSCNESHKYLENDIYLENLVQKEKGHNLQICHRLDTNTEGIVIFSKNDIAHNEILNAFKNRWITKKYLAFVYSKLPKSHDILNAYLKKDNEKKTVKIYNKEVNGSVAICTEYNCIKYIKELNISIAEVTLHTGKTHQIRAHLSYIGCPVIGDPKYSSNEINKKFSLNSQALFAYKYSFEFKPSSPLSYLNDICIKLDTGKIITKIVK